MNPPKKQIPKNNQPIGWPSDARHMPCLTFFHERRRSTRALSVVKGRARAREKRLHCDPNGRRALQRLLSARDAFGEEWKRAAHWQFIAHGHLQENACSCGLLEQSQRDGPLSRHGRDGFSDGPVTISRIRCVKTSYAI